MEYVREGLRREGLQEQAPPVARAATSTRIGAGRGPDQFLAWQRFAGNLATGALVENCLEADSSAVEPAAADEISTPPNERPLEVQFTAPRQSDQELRAMAPIYAQGKTPVLDHLGRASPLDIAPADALATSRQLQQVRQRDGENAWTRSVHGLVLTRGAAFAANAVRQESGGAGKPATAEMSAHVGGARDDEEYAGKTLQMMMRDSGSGQPLPVGARSDLERATGNKLDDVRIHHDRGADSAARMLGARAFTYGRSIYFSSGSYDPGPAGFRLLAHEVAHTVQQQGAAAPQLAQVEVSRPGDPAEQEAEAFATSIAASRSPGNSPLLSRNFASTPKIGRAALRARTAPVALFQRAITFTRSNDAFIQNRMSKVETVDGFQFRTNAVPLFQWRADVRINGSPGDPFANWQVGPHQVGRDYWRNVYWGSGANQTHRLFYIRGGLPMRDATGAGNVWYHDPFAQSFAAAGDVRNTRVADSPQSAEHPWTNPTPGKTGNRGSFNYGFAFVAYISARDTTRGTGRAAFRHLANVYWNFGITGHFDASRPLGSRVTISSGGPVNRSGVIEGGSAEFPTRHGGPIINNNFRFRDL